MQKITFDKTASKFVLEAFDKTTDKEGNIIEKSNPKQKVLTQDGQEITEEEFGGIVPGSTIFVKNDLPTIVKLSDKLNLL